MVATDLFKSSTNNKQSSQPFSQYFRIYNTGYIGDQRVSHISQSRREIHNFQINEQNSK